MWCELRYLYTFALIHTQRTYSLKWYEETRKSYYCIEHMSKKDDNCKLEASISPHVTPAHCHQNMHEILKFIETY